MRAFSVNKKWDLDLDRTAIVTDVAANVVAPSTLYVFGHKHLAGQPATVLDMIEVFVICIAADGRRLNERPAASGLACARLNDQR